MGYTHYWDYDTTSDPHERAARLVLVIDVAKKIIELAAKRGIALAGGDGTSAPELDGKIVLNGAAPEAYETFAFEPLSVRSYRRGRGYGFCKTGFVAIRQYDVVVCAILACIDHVRLADVRSDGRYNDWEAGVALAREAAKLVAPGLVWAGLDAPRALRMKEE